MTSTPRSVSRRLYGSRRHKASSVVASVRRSQYGKAFRRLLSYGPAARKAFSTVVAQQVRHEMMTFLSSKHDVSFSFDGEESIESFAWQDILTTLNSGLPTLYSAVSASMPRKFCNADNQLTYASVLSLLCILVLF